ncbi:GMC family oxidoreductase [Myxococcota bacterium]|nr:GMC family oxidoreductase [Myxococcota bacterium]
MELPPAFDLEADVLVIGGGPSGVAVAERLASAGVECVILEAGRAASERYPRNDRRCYVRKTEEAIRLDESEWGYTTRGHPYDWLRVRAPGGRSLLWGGWCVRLDAQNLRDARRAGAPWPFEAGDLDQHYQRAERFLAASELGLDDTFARIEAELGVAVRPKLAATGPCNCRGWSALDSLRRARMVTDAVATRLITDRAGRVSGVEYVDAKTHAPRVARARAVVVAASPIETARLLLASDLECAPAREGRIGAGLVDHLIGSVIVVQPEPASKVSYPTVSERAASIPRFVNRGNTRRRDYLGGFSLELRGPVAVKHLEPAVRTTIGITEDDLSTQSYYLVHAVGELFPSPDRRVCLDPVRRDAFGRPLVVIEHSIDGNAERMGRDMQESAIAVASSLAVPGSRIVPYRTELGAGGAAHEAGTCRMGKSARTSVTSPTGAVWGTKGLWIADASVLPTALDRPPTLTVLALALSTADNLLEARARGEV